MSALTAIWNKEFKDYFLTPIAYMVIAVFLVVVGWFFFSTFFIKNQANMQEFFQLLPIVFAFVVPALTMRLISEEISLGSYELMGTLPVRPRHIILGKFLACLCLIAAMLLPTLLYPLCIDRVGDLDWGPVLGGYLGALLLGGAYAAIGMLTSSLSRNQIVAFIVGAAVCFALAYLQRMLFFMPEAIQGFVDYLGAGSHFENIAQGVLDIRDVIYFLSIVFLGLYATKLVLESKE
ncbi:MAG: ABC transporter permease [Desulfohalobiaceae bacterium]|nr:ABC transporter permease [Desulfohalobiaceae bacterium]